MNRRALLFPALVALVACQGGELTPPTSLPDQQPSALIVDGARGSGNPDFFWLWPMVSPPIHNANYDPGKSNGQLRPDLFICALNATTAAQVNAATPCKSGAGAYQVSYLALTPGFRFTSADDDIGQYHQFWPTPNSNDIFYRIRAKVGLIELGFIDVFTGKKLLDFRNVNTNLFTTQLDGVPMLIRFRIEQYALCPITKDCASKAVNLATGGSVTTTLPLVGEGGVEIPAQGTGSTTTITVKPCDASDPGFTNMNPAVTDLPTFGPCVTVTATPPLTADLQNSATVFICDIHPLLPPEMDHEQSERITLHRYDPGALVALPHAAHACPAQVGAAGSLKGFFASLGRGSFRSAGKELVAMFTPQPLHAAVALDVGAGGFTDDFSAFQFALPAYLEIVEGDNQTAFPGIAPVTAKVVVKDLEGVAVAGARVRFGATLSLCNADAGTVTTTTGFATRSWTLTAGPNTLLACGRGLAGTTTNGPRVEVVDPFQPIQTHFDGAGSEPPGGPVEVLVLNGSVEFNATGVLGDVLPIEYGSSGWSYQIDGTIPGGWQTTATLPNTGAAPFGSLGSGCGLNTGVVTNWTPGTNTFLYARKTFALTTTATVRIGIAIDNDVQVFLDGVDITNTKQEPGVIFDGGLLKHDDCPTLDSFTFIAENLTAGSHILAFRVRDRGGQSYFDASVTIYSP